MGFHRGCKATGWTHVSTSLLNALGVAMLALGCVSCNVCSGPKNADAFPSSPVPVQESLCHYYQTYTATSPTVNYDSDCGYTVAFGPMGDLKRPQDGYLLEADWGDVPPTQADCASSHTAGTAWGYRCDNRHCLHGDWEQIGKWQTHTGSWNSVSNKCYLGVSFVAGATDYQTVQVQVRAYSGSGANKQQKRAKGYIYVYRHTGHCASAPATPPPPTPQITALPEPPRR
jgi:hypothetical protein